MIWRHSPSRALQVSLDRSSWPSRLGASDPGNKQGVRRFRCFPASSASQARARESIHHREAQKQHRHACPATICCSLQRCSNPLQEVDWRHWAWSGREARMYLPYQQVMPIMASDAQETNDSQPTDSRRGRGIGSISLPHLERNRHFADQSLPVHGRGTWATALRPRHAGSVPGTRSGDTQTPAEPVSIRKGKNR
jgi:hypothetical protein